MEFTRWYMVDAREKEVNNWIHFEGFDDFVFDVQYYGNGQTQIISSSMAVDEHKEFEYALWDRFKYRRTYDSRGDL